jgi:hypothetical protein
MSSGWQGYCKTCFHLCFHSEDGEWKHFFSKEGVLGGQQSHEPDIFQTVPPVKGRLPDNVDFWYLNYKRKMDDGKVKA